MCTKGNFFKAKFDLLDPDPYIEYGSESRQRFEYGFTRIRIRNTGTYSQSTVPSAMNDFEQYDYFKGFCPV